MSRRPRTVRTILGAIVGVALGSMAMSSAGCATMFSGSRSTAVLRSEPAGAEVWVDGEYVGRSPLSISLDPSEPHVAFFRAPGYGERAFRLHTRAGVGWIVLDTLALMFPLIIDSLTEAWFYFLPVDAQLAPNAAPPIAVPPIAAPPAAAPPAAAPLASGQTTP